MNFFKDIENVIRVNETELLARAERALVKAYPEVHTAEDFYVYATGDIPMCLVAHVDTVRLEYQRLYLEITKSYIRNRNGVLGADDRAGVFAIFEIIRKTKNKPSILLTNYEEVGSIGAKWWVCNNVWNEKDVLFIELDRKGRDEYVHYNGPLPKQVETYIESFGFRKAWGTSSDIEIITDAYGVPSVNLSIGFKNEHTKNEILVLNHMKSTIKRVIQMVENPLTKLYPMP